MVDDEHEKEMIRANLSTELPKGAVTMGKNWQEYMFENMPVAAAVTLLSKAQSDVRYAEGEVLHRLVSNVDVKDLRVNKPHGLRHSRVAHRDQWRSLPSQDSHGRRRYHPGARSVCGRTQN